MSRTRAVDLKHTIEGHLVRLETLSNEFRSIVSTYPVEVSDNEMNQITDIIKELYSKLSQAINVTAVTLDLKTKFKAETSPTVAVPAVKFDRLKLTPSMDAGETQEFASSKL